MTNYNYSHSTFEFGKVLVDGFVSEGKEYVVPGGFLEKFKVHRQTWHNWVKGKELDSIPVKIGKRKNVPATAYRTPDLTEFVTELAMGGNVHARIALQGTFQADLERTVKETNNIQVTASQHQANRVLIDEKLIAKYILLVQQSLEEANPFSEEAEARSATIRDIHYNQMTSLEREVALERQLDASGDDIWRIGLEEGVDTVTDSTGVLVATVETVERYKRRDQMLQQKQGV